MTNKLLEICDFKREDVARRKAATSMSSLQARAGEQTPPRGFRRALDTAATTGFGLIAEVKKASPSKGLIRPDFDPPAHAAAYAAGGAACLSVLTDEPYFQGRDDYLVAARAACALPVLRKDFIVDPWQVLESRALGADAILIIVAALDDTQMREIEDAALGLGMDALVEVHDEPELERALALRSRLIGVNNRDLRDFTVDFARTYELVGKAPEGCTFVAESGLTGHADLIAMATHGVRCFLVGETLMRQPDVEAATRALLTGA
ncbi:indole-3-glycerol phosphate synthase TrpC [Sphingobium sp. CCH11-B1]|jgi:indole-3-glycerol phosphate synthase|uniref:indole-3-glycerol phosphate synthase TrpC n=1 Tax=Sphingobium sp. CCH11-B1 TaxID=1768781 RepID=UPI0008356902|nr:indole-3-glycerol phosphate synthase TrpC [Sphingobium sp. CCH11-B1]MEA3391308.1 indole-3-glycerol phosphate synthase TrpC [Pseudomonadota bacterium]